MQTSKLLRTVSKLRQLQDEFNTCPASLVLWTIKRTPDSPGELPPGLREATHLQERGFNRQSQTLEQVITTAGPVDEHWFGPGQLFFGLVRRTDDLLKQLHLAPEYHDADTLYAVADLSLRNRINLAAPYYWQGGHVFAKNYVDRKLIKLACMDWFTKVDRLPEAVGDTIDELLNRLEQSDEKQPPSKPEQPQPKRYRKKSAVPAKKSQRELAFEWLKLWHRYGTEDFNTDPIPGKTERQHWMAGKNEGKPGPCPSDFTHMFQAKFGSHSKYRTACQNGSIEQLLTVAAGDAGRVYQSSKQSMERSTYDSEIDLD